jgi:transposase
LHRECVTPQKAVAVPVFSLRPGESPRLQGQDKAHIARLAEAEAPLPPILVDRRTMRVIDGMHRLMAASLKGEQTVEVEFFDGSAEDAFLAAVKANVTHGLPLQLADRRAAASRIIASHPQMSDRSVAETVGLAARTVAAIRRRCAGLAAQPGARVGRDGKVRPLSGVDGRRRAAELLAERPGASLREVARVAGVSPATVRDVRQRLARGAELAPGLAGPGAGGGQAGGSQDRPAGAAGLEKLLRDPSLRHTEQGRRLLRLLQLNAAGEQEWPGVMAALPPHCAATVVQLAHQYGRMWLNFAQELDERAQIMDPWAAPQAGTREFNGQHH